MYKISLNIGYDGNGHSGILNRIPICVNCTSVRNFTNYIRRSCLTLADWAAQNYIPKSTLNLYVYIEREYSDSEGEWLWTNEFVIKCKNIREFLPFMNMSNEEIQSQVKANERQEKIDDIIDEEGSN